MNNELTLAVLEELKRKGFKYVIVNGFTHDRRSDYMEPYYFVLEPVKQLPDDASKKGIYEPIDSALLMEWAKYSHEGARVFVSSH
ncbi:MAG TPA: hypothetical protein VHD83_12905 [Puia sp.]|nr:hypothetical protein [Puia sp.]